MIPKEVIARVKNLPAVSQAALKLVALLDQPAVSNEDVVLVLKYDTVLTAKLLRACNSPYYGFDEQIASVEQAVMVLGHQQILHMVLSLAFGGAMSAVLPGYAAEARELWSHSLTTALACERLVQNGLRLEAPAPVAFTAGLLHDIGKLALNQALSSDDQFAVRCRAVRDRLPWHIAEQDVLGTDHGEVGACLLDTWRLPGDIVEAVAHHHRPVTAPAPKLSSVIHVADSLVHLTDADGAWENYTALTDARANASWSITPEKLRGLMIEVQDSARQAEHFMDLA